MSFLSIQIGLFMKQNHSKHVYKCNDNHLRWFVFRENEGILHSFKIIAEVLL